MKDAQTSPVTGAAPEADEALDRVERRNRRVHDRHPDGSV
jgi:hypothetical protein